MMNLKEFIETRQLIEHLSQPIEDYVKESETDDFSSTGYDFRFLDSFGQASMIYNEYLYETLLKSYELNRFFDKLKDIVNIAETHTNNDKFSGWIKTTSKFDENDPRFISLCDLFNIYVAKIERPSSYQCYVLFEVRKPEDVTDEVYQHDFLYHITTSSKANKILRYGLQPKSHSKKSYHPERVYLLIPSAKLNLKSMMTQLGGDVVLKVDLNKLKKYEQKFKFYRDPMQVGDSSVFCENTIYPEVISKVKI